MPANPIRPNRLPAGTPQRLNPLLPTIVVASYKGGVWKTSISVAIAERLAWAGSRVLLLTSDSQEDARARLGVSGGPPIGTVGYGHGLIKVLGLRGQHAASLMYREGTDRLQQGIFDLVVVDTPPTLIGGRLPGVLLVAPIGGIDAARNLGVMLTETPANTDIVLVKIRRSDPDEWAAAANGIMATVGRQMDYLTEPLPSVKLVAQAHNNAQSVWTLPREGATLQFLNGIDTLAQMASERLPRRQPWTPLPPPEAAIPYIRGWDYDED